MFSPEDITSQKEVAGICQKYLIVVSVFLTLASTTAYTLPSVGAQVKWTCNDEKGLCSKNSTTNESVWFPSAELCQLVCGEDGAISPKPRHVRFYDKRYIPINPAKITLHIAAKSNNTATQNVIKTFLDDLHKKHPNCNKHNNTKVTVNIDMPSNPKLSELKIGYDQTSNPSISELTTQYDLTTRTLREVSVTVHISTIRVSGLQYALRTLSQLMAPYYPEPNKPSCLAIVRAIQVDDKPVKNERS